MRRPRGRFTNWSIYSYVIGKIERSLAGSSREASVYIGLVAYVERTARSNCAAFVTERTPRQSVRTLREQTLTIGTFLLELRVSRRAASPERVRSTR